MGIEFLGAPSFRFVYFPIGSVLLGVWVKTVSRNDKFSTLKKEDFAIGLDLWRTAVLLFVVATSERVEALTKLEKSLANMPSMPAPSLRQLQGQIQASLEQLLGSIWLVAVLVFGLWGVSTTVRKLGWRAADDMNTPIGIALPLASGVLMLIVVMAVAK
ncbi:MAG TPA: hypothetical protein VKY89_01280 [Thermoanaerobaculia bacterium]|nr:hypothetical protein [Thermoanaerobaculia bacterium]